MQQLYTMIGRLGIFLICAQAIVHFRPREAYDKYCKLLVSVMLLAQLLQPISQLLTGETAGSIREEALAFEAELEDRMEEAGRQAEAAEARLEQISLTQLEEQQQEEETVPMEKNLSVEAQQKGAEQTDIQVKPITVEWGEKEEP